ncbi:Fanconi anemia core complex-associated protein 100 [Pteronotus mesoamericanus]|uniref:Fanconi anemia core complex-associated protein 100 n=1 Tax=Pteronotus mesoamericanus TaxID=1884717 RepID=UPI0023EB8615|nr:Fanconi anemia core complex-associated protein 100 [Pteronotus parnellii mesoamericanus]
MAGIAPRVDYLAGFSCPVGGLAAGKARVLCLGAEIFLSTGRKRVYVYNLEGRQLTAAYRFPGQVCHLEVLVPRRELLVLCAQRGVYCLSLDQENRSRSRSDGDDGDGEPPCPVVAVGPDACVLPDPTLCAFTVLDNALITLAQGAPHWKVQLFECPCPGQDPRPPGQIGEVELSTYPTSAGSPGTPEAPRVPPVLCCVRPPGSGVPHSVRRGPGGFTLEGALFGVLFGADATLLGSPVVLCGLPSGQLCWVALRTLVTSRSAPGDPKALVRILHHLEEPVIFIGALRTEPPSEDVEDACCDCLVALGHRGRALAVKARWDEAGVLVPELREHRLLGPVLCAACGGGGRLYHSTPSSLCEVVLARGSAPGLSEGADVRPESPGGLPAALCPAGLSVCGVVALAVSPWSPGGGPELLALSARGRLLACRLAQSSETLWAAGGTVADPHRKVKDLLLSISSVSERASSLKKAIDQRNKALTCLNEAMNVSCALLSSREGPRPISCTTATAWSRRELQDVLTATCLLENSSGSPLGRGWVLCIQVLPGSLASDPDAAGSAATYTVPVGQLGPGGRREVTLTLGPSEDGVLDLPMTVSCALFCSLAEALGGALDPWGSFRDAPAGGRPPSTPAEPGGICLPLGEHTVDMLQCLRFPGLAAPPAQAPGPRGPASGPVDTFLEAGGGPGSQRAGPEPLRAVLLPPPVAAVKVSVELLRAACGGSRSGASLCCATLQWLLAENAAEGVVRAQALSSVQGVAPDGADVRLTVHEVTVTDVCPAGPLRAVEIQVESTSLASMCMAHSAVLGRLQRVVVEQAARGHSLPDLRLQYLHQIRANHEALLREVQTLRDRLCTEDTASSCTATEQLLQLYRQLRSPSLLLL